MVAFATVMLSNLSAQEEAVRFGAKAGLNIASITGDFTDELSSKIGFTLGGVVEIPVSDKFAFQPEVLFSTQGAKYEDSDVGFSDESTVKLSYINIPMMAKFYVAEGLSLQAGPQLGILVSAKDEGEYTEQNVTVEYDTDIKDDLSTVDFGLNFGLGYQLEGGLFFDGRYNLGLSNINDYEGSDNVNQKNSVIQFAVGYKF
ncbi:outer membrane protein with beta-barrel domain [Aquimarina intermedia]|uniref:Outer membrane protein with beta-barrel domain n=2 Tax=Aquimarina intermedia TaxID=350814 RepID=A0A5S5C6Z4_9FLAO|nr:outer membrane protein with beta-barrel domain [Aquimarina intermedia]